MRRFTRYSPGWTFVGMVRVIPVIDTLYRRFYPAHHEYEFHTGEREYARRDIFLDKYVEPNDNPDVSGLEKIWEEYNKRGSKIFLVFALVIILLPLGYIILFSQPIFEMVKDFIKTFQPYKSPRERNREWLQPLDGIKNILLSVLNIIVRISQILLITALMWVAVPIAAIVLFFCCFVSSKARYAFFPALVLGITLLASPLLVAVPTLFTEPILRIFRGITQILFTLPTYFPKKALRHFLTPKNYKSLPTAEANNTIKMIIADLKTLPATSMQPEPTASTTPISEAEKDANPQHLIIAFMLHTVHFKYVKSQWKGKTCDPQIKAKEATLYKTFVNAKQAQIAAKVKKPYEAQEVKDAQETYQRFVLNELANAPQLVS